MTYDYRFEMYAYPPAYRDTHGTEIAATAVEVTAGAWSFRQSRSLVVAGLRTRVNHAIHDRPANAWGQALITLLGIFAVGASATSTAYLFGIDDGATQFYDDASLILAFSAALAVCLVIRAQWALIPLAGWAVLWGTRTQPDGAVVAALAVFAVLIGAAVFLAVARTSTRRAFSPTVGLGLYGFGLACAFASNSVNAQWYIVATLLGPLVFGLCIALVDPRPLMVSATALAGMTAIMLALLAVDDSALGSGAWVGVAIQALITLGLCGLSQLGLRRSLRLP